MTQNVYNNPHHKQARRQTQTLLNHGHTITCRRCNQPIHPGQPFDIGHPQDATPGGPTTTTGLAPEHPHCNRSAGATAGNHHKHHKTPPSRNW